MTGAEVLDKTYDDPGKIENAAVFVGPFAKSIEAQKAKTKNRREQITKAIPDVRAYRIMQELYDDNPIDTKVMGTLCESFENLTT